MLFESTVLAGSVFLLRAVGEVRENVFIMVNNFWFLLLFLTCLWLYKPAPIKASRIGRESEKRSIFSIYVHICIYGEEIPTAFKRMWRIVYEKRINCAILILLAFS